MVVKPPKDSDLEVAAFCQELVPGQKPFYVEIVGGEVADNCHGNIAALVESNGGHQLCGWSIWRDTRGRYLEAIYHSIYVSPSGERTDITPDADGERQRLFLPAFGEIHQNGMPIPSRYKALVDTPAVIESLRLFDEASKLQASVRDDEPMPEKVEYRMNKLREKANRFLKS